MNRAERRARKAKARARHQRTHRAIEASSSPYNWPLYHGGDGRHGLGWGYSHRFGTRTNWGFRPIMNDGAAIREQIL